MAVHSDIVKTFFILTTIMHILYGRTYKTPIDSKTFEEVSRDDRKTIYKDKNHTYKYYDREFRKIEEL